MKISEEKSKNTLIKLAGAWKDNSEVVSIMKKSYNERKKFKLRDIKF